MIARACSLVLGIAALTTTRDASACSYFANRGWEMAGEPSDVTPPTIASLRMEAVRTRAAGSCPATALAHLVVFGADDQNVSGQLGAIVDLVELRYGQVDPWGGAYGQPMARNLEGEFLFSVSYDEGFSATFAVSLVDPSGNVGESRLVTAELPPHDEGCSTTGASSGLVAIAVIGLRRRRRCRG